MSSKRIAEIVAEEEEEEEEEEEVVAVPTKSTRRVPKRVKRSNK